MLTLAKAAYVLLITINGNYTVDTETIYFASGEACETAKPAMIEQIHKMRFLGHREVIGTCYQIGETE